MNQKALMILVVIIILAGWLFSVLGNKGDGPESVVNGGNNVATTSPTQATTTSEYIFEPPEPETLPKLAFSDNNLDTSEWLTYENEEFGFAFDYPKEWEAHFNTWPAEHRGRAVGAIASVTVLPQSLSYTDGDALLLVIFERSLENAMLHALQHDLKLKQLYSSDGKVIIGQFEPILPAQYTPYTISFDGIIVRPEGRVLMDYPLELEKILLSFRLLED